MQPMIALRPGCGGIGLACSDPTLTPDQPIWPLGHKKLDTTALSTRVALKALGEITSALEHLATTLKPPV